MASAEYPPRRWQPEQLLTAMRPRGPKWQHVCVVGCYDRRSIFYNQQIRALCQLAALAERAGGELARQRIAVIGAGAAGCTAALAACYAGAGECYDKRTGRRTFIDASCIVARHGPWYYAEDGSRQRFIERELPRLSQACTDMGGTLADLRLNEVRSRSVVVERPLRPETHEPQDRT
ncbi:MAG: hypothetical protein AAGC55_30325 [Myxococcota bacterium]